jgi:hypothetical protein
MAAMKTVVRRCVLDGERWPTDGSGSDMLMHHGQKKGEVSDTLI